jgi:hypothetical protein
MGQLPTRRAAVLLDGPDGITVSEHGFRMWVIKRSAAKTAAELEQLGR